LKRNTLLFLVIFIFFNVSCAVTPAGTPQIIMITQEVFVTQQVMLPTLTPLIITATPVPTSSEPPPTPTKTLSHDWVDFGGICMRPDNLPAGTQINPDPSMVEQARALFLESLWRPIVLSENSDKLVPSFSSAASLITATSKEVYLRGPFIPIGKLPPYSDARSFTLQDPVMLWNKIHPNERFKGLSLNPICIEFYPPMHFEEQKRLNPDIHHVSLVGDVAHAKFDLENILGSPRLNIKLYQNPYGGVRAYKDLLGFIPSTTAQQNAQAANEHFGALLLTFKTVLWGNFDGDGTPEFGYGPKNSDPLPAADFQPVILFMPYP